MSESVDVGRDRSGGDPGEGGAVPSGAAGAATVEKAVTRAEARIERVVDESLKKIQRVYVAVHGIGDQSQYATIQNVASQIGACFGSPVSIPLGSFHSQRTRSSGFLFVDAPPYPARFKDVGFAEIYWAGIPRAVQKEGHSLEEAKKWASTLVSRIRMLQEGGRTAPRAGDYRMLEQVIGEMIEGIAILDRLLFLVGKVSSFKFGLKTLLDSFLGDVQVVTEFEVQRVELMAQFRAIMDQIREANDQVDIYIVAHSEGTVVSLLALLQAFKEYAPASAEAPEQFGWIRQVKGLMTFGSPIEEHLLLWPELFNKPFQAPVDPATGQVKPVYRWCPADPGSRIKWRNYLDHGDPIAYRLRATRDWIRENRWGDVIEFEKFHAENPGRHEIAFSRYLFPGKAHGGYWGDRDVFGHFIKTVVEKTPGRGTPGPELDERFENPPASRPGVGFFSRVVPYLIPALLLMTAVWIMTRGIHGFLYPDGWKHDASGARVERVDTMRHLSRDVVGISLLLMGITVAARVPRLNRTWRGLIVAYLVFLAGAAVYPLIATRDTREFLGSFTQILAPRVPIVANLAQANPVDRDVPGVSVAGPESGAQADPPTVDGPGPGAPAATSPREEGGRGWARRMAGHYTSPVLGLLTLAALLVLATMWVSSARPTWGARTLIVPGFLIILAVVAYGVFGPDAETLEKGPIWPVLLAGVAFLYLWWLSVVFFDLIYVWHHYVRGSARGATMTDRLRVICKDPCCQETAPA